MRIFLVFVRHFLANFLLGLIAVSSRIPLAWEILILRRVQWLYQDLAQVPCKHECRMYSKWTFNTLGSTLKKQRIHALVQNECTINNMYNKSMQKHARSRAQELNESHESEISNFVTITANITSGVVSVHSTSTCACTCASGILKTGTSSPRDWQHMRSFCNKIELLWLVKFMLSPGKAIWKISTPSFKIYLCWKTSLRWSPWAHRMFDTPHSSHAHEQSWNCGSKYISSYDNWKEKKSVHNRPSRLFCYKDLADKL